MGLYIFVHRLYVKQGKVVLNFISYTIIVLEIKMSYYEYKEVMQGFLTYAYSKARKDNGNS